MATTSKGQVALPQAVLKAAGLKPGDEVDVRQQPLGEYTLKGPAHFVSTTRGCEHPPIVVSFETE
jgi:bifunctional DNA-binding transcriptional regulator/antitoxin component of YhaV-PrlF toxin-antitoxin module